MTENAWGAARQAFEIEAEALTEALAHVDRDAFDRAVAALVAAPRIAATGCGHSGFACRHFAHLMCCIERPARFISPAEAVHGASGYVQAGDAVLWISRGGKTGELLPIVDICNKKGATVIGITENLASPLAQKSDIVLKMHVTRETDKWNTQGTTSFCVTNAIIESLQAAMIEETGFTTESFALVHPGGAVGERLNGKSL